MTICAIIGGSGFYQLENFTQLNEPVKTPYGEVNGISCGEIASLKVYFLPRHGGSHNIAPHKINYRANIYALKSLGVERIIAVNAVGGISKPMRPGTLAIPDQVIDYSYGREHTFVGGHLEGVQHIDFSEPFCASLRQSLIAATAKLPPMSCRSEGTYACTQGPRLESAAEISRLARDGNDLVGMTLMPEAALAKELGLSYASVCAIANWGAGISSEALTMEAILSTLEMALGLVKMLICGALEDISQQKS